MSRLIPLLLLAVSATPAIAQDLTTEERRALVETWYETMDYDMLADELEWVHASGFFGGETLTTRAQVEEQLTPFYFEVFDDIAVDIHRVEVGESSVFSFGTYNLTPKNSTEVHTANFVHVWTIDDDGRLDGLVQYADTWSINLALADGRVLKGD
ncbi:nuclear transport factor 2 family protein [Aestuariibius insulae]|uniref:nuclear transport factor 2 family protein n=1 Tax=Aestuariibius insulae TaxID=2058287 RepID=UPI00345E367C